MKTKDIHSILQRPLVTEKTSAQKDHSNQVVFMVRRDANKAEIGNAVEKLFTVKVSAVNTSIQRGKDKRVGKSVGRRPNWKKAIVTLAPGQDVDFFGGHVADEDQAAE